MHLTLATETARLPGPPTEKYPDGAPFVVGLRHGTMSVELYAPRGRDLQVPHAQDELYIVATGRGDFLCGDRRVSFAPHDVLFAPAGAEHRFENFSDDFTTWVVFYGPNGGEK